MDQSINMMRSLLFVPGNRPERFAKARYSGTDIYCIDLEDSVPAAEKGAARSAAIEHVMQCQSETDSASLVAIRINSLRTLDGIKDLVALAEHPGSTSSLDYIILPMTTSAVEIKQVAEVLSGQNSVKIIPLIETPDGIDHLGEILDASDRVHAAGFGVADYTAITGTEINWDALLYARSRISEICNARGVHCFDGPWFNIADANGLADEARRVSQLGFGGKLAIHPSQVEVINQAFMPSENKVLWARKIIECLEKAGGGVVSVDGVMIDQPLVKRARKILTLANIMNDRGQQ